MKRVDRVRIGIISTLGVIIGGVLIYSTLYALNWLPDFGSDSGQNYAILERPLETDPIEVVEFFSYACPFCYSLEDLLGGWKSGLPEDVEVKHIHVAFDTLTTRLAKTHLVLQSQGLLETNHGRIFRAIHDQNKTLLTDERVADLVDGHGTDRERFLASIASRQITRRVQANNQLINEVGAPGVPSMLIANRYIVSNLGGSREMLSTASWLIDEIRAGRAPEKVDEDTSTSDDEPIESEQPSSEVIHEDIPTETESVEIAEEEATFAEE